MMGYDPPPNDPLFSYNVQLETRVRKDHPLRKIKELVDFDFIYGEAAKTYGANGNVSIPPPVLLKLVALLVLYNVRSERELMRGNGVKSLSLTFLPASCRALEGRLLRS